MSYALAVAKFSKTRTRASYQIMASHRILYVGRDLNLLQFLSKILEDCQIVRCPGGSNARLLIESDIKYSLLLFDDELIDTTGAELTQFARSLPHREQTPLVIYEKSDNLKMLVEDILRLLG